jgi:hypothetical protein
VFLNVRLDLSLLLSGQVRIGKDLFFEVIHEQRVARLCRGEVRQSLSVLWWSRRGSVLETVEPIAGPNDPRGHGVGGRS